MGRMQPRAAAAGPRSRRWPGRTAGARFAGRRPLVSGRRHGAGRQVCHSGVYVGEFKDGEMSGSGRRQYCDGGSYSGNNATAVPVTFNGTQRFIHYRGARNLDFALGTLARDHGMGDATDVLISGDSAGGLASYWHADRFASAFPKAFVATVPDSGWVCISFPLYQLVLPALLLLGGTRSEHLRTADSQVFHRGPDEACMALGVAVDRRGDEQHCGLGRLLRCCRRPAW